MRIPIVVLQTKYVVIWLWMWQRAPSVPCTQYGCFLVQWCDESVAIVPVGQSLLPASTDSTFAWLLLGYVRHYGRFPGRIIRNFCMPRFCLGRTQKPERMMLAFFYKAYWSFTHKKSQEIIIRDSQNGSFLPLHRVCKKRCSRLWCASALKS